MIRIFFDESLYLVPLVYQYHLVLGGNPATLPGMYLKSLQLHGFKTFAAKTQLQFEPGITAIVGPNGSGKSNIADAIRWVLGEQSARSLRSSRMEDVIFGGSRKSRPLGFADVQVTLDNEDRHFALDYSEVAIRRRYHRSGESEFNLNKTTCRLGDIQNMLMDTGLGKGAYSIIGQGQVASVLSSKPEERRAIFEEAAGINRFKNQKRKAEARLDNTQVNLFRLGDIVSELETRLPTLEEEAEKAERAQALNLRIGEVEKAIFAADLKKVRGELGQMGTLLKELEETSVSTGAQQNTVELSLEQMQLKFSEAEKSLHALAQEKTRLEADRAQWQNRLKHHGEITRTLSKEQQRAETSLGQINTRLEDINRELDTLADRAAALKTRQTAAEESFEATQERARRVQAAYGDMAAQSGEKQKEMLDALDTLTRLKERLATLNENVRWRGLNLAQLTGHIDQLKEQVQATQTSQQEAQSRLDQHTQERDTHSQALKLQKETVEAATQKLDQLQREREEVLGALSKAAAEETLLRQLQEQGEGLEEGVKHLREAAKKGLVQGFVGVLGELLKAPTETLDALEAALGPHLQTAVFETPEQAAAALDWLNKEQKGRAILWGGGAAPAAALHGQSLARRVQAQAALTPLLHRLLGQVVLVENFTEDDSLTQVSAQGQVRQPGGLLTGGRGKAAAASPLRRKDQLDKLAASLQTLRARQGSIDAEVDATRAAMQQARQKTDELALLVDQTQRALAVAKEQVSQLTRQQEQLGRELAQKQQEQSEMEEKGRAEAAEQEKLTLELNTHEETHSRLQEERNTLAAHQEELLRQKEEQDKALSAARLELSEVLGQLAQTQALEKNLLAEQARLKETLAEVQKTLSHTREELHSLGNFEQEYEQATAELTHRLGALQTQTESATSHEVKVHEELAQLQHRRKTLAEQHRAARERLENERLREARLQSRQEEMLTQGKELLGLTDEDIEEALNADTPLEYGVRAEVKRLKDELRDMGFVNLGAIREKQSVQARLVFLKTHYEDLFEARQKLLEMIGRIEEQTKEAFLATFEAVKVAFGDLFSGMVPGGTGDLCLLEPESPLESGIEILVQMPGKARGPLTRLSGGEQTLTAITLLFSILKVKPSPFCLLDEIEAALDEPNTVRFTKFLREFAQGVQFIVITHNKRTMEAADALLGVTMEEDGISKIVSVKLNQVQDVLARQN